MTDLEQTVAALAERVALLEAENTRLRLSAEPRPMPSDTGRTQSRRSLLAGSAGLLGALAGSKLLAPGQAAAAAAPITTHVVQARQYVAPVLLGTRVTLAPQRGGGYHWARYVWDMDGSFAGEQPPAVLAAASDDYHGSGERAEPTVAVTLQREAGTWRAEILVNHVGHLATEVSLNAVAFGSSE